MPIKTIICTDCSLVVSIKETVSMLDLFKASPGGLRDAT